MYASLGGIDIILSPCKIEASIAYMYYTAAVNITRVYIRHVD